MATGSSQLDITDSLEMPMANGKYLSHVSRAIATVAPNYIIFPTPINVTRFVEKFQSVALFKAVDEMAIMDITEVNLRSLVFL